MTDQRIGLQEADGSATHPSGIVEVLFRGTPLLLSRHDVDAMLTCQQQWWWSAFYKIGLLDIGESCVRTGFQGKNPQITLKEYDELSLAVQEACLQLDW